MFIHLSFSHRSPPPHAVGPSVRTAERVPRRFFRNGKEIPGTEVLRIRGEAGGEVDVEHLVRLGRVSGWYWVDWNGRGFEWLTKVTQKAYQNGSVTLHIWVFIDKTVYMDLEARL